MSEETANKLFDDLRAIRDAAYTAAPGLANLVPDLKAELSRLATQGAMEAANLFFNGSAFVPSGPGQQAPDLERGSVFGSASDSPSQVAAPEPQRSAEHTREREGMGR
jgi:hypothetical protein